MESSAQLQACLRTSANATCFDCTEPQAHYLSSDFGVTLCEACAHFHQSNDISNVIDLMDSSHPESHSIHLLTYGGNAPFAQYLAGFKVKPTAPPEFKYKIRAAWAYRSCLIEAIETRHPPFLPLLRVEDGLVWEPIPPQLVESQLPIVEAAKEVYEIAAEQGEHMYRDLNDLTKSESVKRVESKVLGALEKVNQWLGGKPPSDA